MANEISITFGSLQLNSTNNITVAKIDLKENKTVKAFNIPKTNHAIAEEAKRNTALITISGDIAGSSYDDLRTNLDVLRAGLQNGKQQLTLDDDRYIVCQVKNLSIPFVKLQLMAKWSATFIADDPIWYSQAESVDSREPVSGVGYTIANAGNAPVRAKIEVFPLEPLVDDVQIENTTLGSLLKYRGTVTPQVSNGDFEDWAGGPSADPDGWTTTGVGVAIAREGTIVKLSTFSAKLTRVGANVICMQDIHATKGLAYWKGKTLTIGCWVYATAANRARIYIHDSVGTGVSPYHTGSGTWEWLEASRLIDSSSTSISVNCAVDNASADAYFDGMMVIGVDAEGVGLEIDNRFDTEDFEVLNDGVDDHTNFEGDFIILNPGNNTIEFTGGLNSSVKITHRDGWF